MYISTQIYARYIFVNNYTNILYFPATFHGLESLNIKNTFIFVLTKYFET